MPTQVTWYLFTQSLPNLKQASLGFGFVRWTCTWVFVRALRALNQDNSYHKQPKIHNCIHRGAVQWLPRQTRFTVRGIRQQVMLVRLGRRQVVHGTKTPLHCNKPSATKGDLSATNRPCELLHLHWRKLCATYAMTLNSSVELFTQQLGTRNQCAEKHTSHGMEPWRRHGAWAKQWWQEMWLDARMRKAMWSYCMRRAGNDGSVSAACV